MLKKHTSRNVNRFVGQHDPRRGGAVCAVLSGDRDVACQAPAVKADLLDFPRPAAASRIGGTADAPMSLWWSVLASFAEGFGAYGVALYPTADFPIQAALVSSRDSLRDHGGREHASGPLPENATRPGDGLALDARPERHRSWLAFIHDAGASLWARRRREREIRRAVAALGQFDDRTLRDMGISSRSEIERVVRYCHDC